MGILYPAILLDTISWNNELAQYWATKPWPVWNDAWSSHTHLLHQSALMSVLDRGKPLFNQMQAHYRLQIMFLDTSFDNLLWHELTFPTTTCLNSKMKCIQYDIRWGRGEGEGRDLHSLALSTLGGGGGGLVLPPPFFSNTQQRCKLAKPKTKETERIKMVMPWCFPTSPYRF